MLGAANLMAAASPAGTVWDCVISGGGQKGIAFLTFSEEAGSDGYTRFSGYQLLTTSVKKSSNGADERTPYGDNVGRTTETSQTEVSKTNLFGFGQISGPWGYDAKGRIIGSFVERVATDMQADTSASSAVSFNGKVVPGRRLTLVASTPNGRLTFNGAPYRQMPDLSGSWYATRKMNNQSFVEFFTLSSFAADNPLSESYPDLSNYPIYYLMGGQGPGYSVDGFSMVSSQKKIGFALMNTPTGSTNSVLNATIGSLSTSKGVYKTKAAGVQEPMLPISFEATLPGLIGH